MLNNRHKFDSFSEFSKFQHSLVGKTIRINGGDYVSVKNIVLKGEFVDIQTEKYVDSLYHWQ